MDSDPDPDPGGPKTYGSATLPILIFLFWCCSGERCWVRRPSPTCGSCGTGPASALTRAHVALTSSWRISWRASGTCGWGALVRHRSGMRRRCTVPSDWFSSTTCRNLPEENWVSANSAKIIQNVRNCRHPCRRVPTECLLVIRFRHPKA